MRTEFCINEGFKAILSSTASRQCKGSFRHLVHKAEAAAALLFTTTSFTF
jgi:hypothetical protein